MSYTIVDSVILEEGKSGWEAVRCDMTGYTPEQIYPADLQMYGLKGRIAHRWAELLHTSPGNIELHGSWQRPHEPDVWFSLIRVKHVHDS